MENQTKKKKSSFGIALLGIFLALTGVMMMAQATDLFTGPRELFGDASSPEIEQIREMLVPLTDVLEQLYAKTSMRLYLAFGFLIGLLAIVSGIGMILLKEWARKLVIVFSFLMMIHGIFLFTAIHGVMITEEMRYFLDSFQISKTPEELASFIWKVAFPIFCLPNLFFAGYVCREKIKKRFRDDDLAQGDLS